jgi:hypothetical protein
MPTDPSCAEKLLAPTINDLWVLVAGTVMRLCQTFENQSLTRLGSAFHLNRFPFGCGTRCRSQTWSGTLDSNQRSPPSEGGENNQTSLVPGKSNSLSAESVVQFHLDSRMSAYLSGQSYALATYSVMRTVDNKPRSKLLVHS